MSLNASGLRDTARVLRISPDTVLRELKKKEVALASVNAALLRTLNPEEVTVDMERAGEAEMDAMGSVVGKKKEPRGLWHAIDHAMGAVLASVVGRRKDAVFLQLQALLEPLGLSAFRRIIGGRTRGISLLRCMVQASVIHRKASAST
jgi:hypothetical protein